MEISFDVQNKSNNIFEQEKFKLKKDEKGRIVILEPQVKAEFCHWVTDKNSVGVAGQDNGTYYICNGDYQTVSVHNNDAQKCPFCRESMSNSLVREAKRRFVTLILVYTTSPAGAVMNPVTFKIVPWLFGEDKFNNLISKKSEWGDLRQRDLVVSCEGGKYQKMTLDVAAQCLWTLDANLKNAVAQEYSNVSAKLGSNLVKLLGKTLSSDLMENLIIELKNSTPTIPEYPQNIQNLLNGAGGQTPVFNQPTGQQPTTFNNTNHQGQNVQPGHTVNPMAGIFNQPAFNNPLDNLLGGAGQGNQQATQNQNSTGVQPVQVNQQPALNNLLGGAVQGNQQAIQNQPPVNNQTEVNQTVKPPETSNLNNLLNMNQNVAGTSQQGTLPAVNNQPPVIQAQGDFNSLINSTLGDNLQQPNVASQPGQGSNQQGQTSQPATGQGFQQNQGVGLPDFKSMLDSTNK